MDTADVADALPGADRARVLAVALLAEQAPAERVAAAVAQLLEAAGGPDAGNAVRARLERQPLLLAAGADPSARVLAAAARLHEEAEADLRAALAAAGVHREDPRRSERAAYAERVLAARGEQVREVLRRLAET